MPGGACRDWRRVRERWPGILHRDAWGVVRLQRLLHVMASLSELCCFDLFFLGYKREPAVWVLGSYAFGSPIFIFIFTKRLLVRLLYLDERQKTLCWGKHVKYLHQRYLVQRPPESDIDSLHYKENNTSKFPQNRFCRDFKEIWF